MKGGIALHTSVLDPRRIGGLQRACVREPMHILVDQLPERHRRQLDNEEHGLEGNASLAINEAGDGAD
jgi:hypothetical protein